MCFTGIRVLLLGATLTPTFYLVLLGGSSHLGPAASIQYPPFISHEWPLRNNPILRGRNLTNHGVNHSPPPPGRPPPRHLAVLSLVLDLWLPRKPKALPRRHSQRPNARQHQTGECDSTMAIDGVVAIDGGGGTGR